MDEKLFKFAVIVVEGDGKMLVTDSGDDAEQLGVAAWGRAAQGNIALLVKPVGLWRPVTEPVEFIDLGGDPGTESEGPKSEAPRRGRKPGSKNKKSEEGAETLDNSGGSGTDEPDTKETEESEDDEVPAPEEINVTGEHPPLHEDEYSPFDGEGVEESPPATEPVAEAPVKQSSYWTCRQCGKCNSGGRTHCTDCGVAKEEVTAAHPATDLDAIVRRRVGMNDTTCLRCKGPTVLAIAGRLGKIRICQNEDCHASLETQDALRKLDIRAAAAATRTGADDTEEIPEASEVKTGHDYLGIEIETPPATWYQEEITQEGGESNGGQLKCLNTVLTEAGYGGKLRHPAVGAILGNPFIESLLELKKAEAHICITWFERATPAHLAVLAEKVEKDSKK